MYKYSYCGTLDDTENYLSNKICYYIFCIISSKKKEIILSAAIIFGALFIMSKDAKLIRVPLRLPSAFEINRLASQ